MEDDGYDGRLCVVRGRSNSPHLAPATPGLVGSEACANASSPEPGRQPWMGAVGDLLKVHCSERQPGPGLGVNQEETSSCRGRAQAASLAVVRCALCSQSLALLWKLTEPED